jgi:hypothetical protein
LTFCFGLQIDELLRHFWALIPVNTEDKKAKFIRIQVRKKSCEWMYNFCFLYLHTGAEEEL